MKPVDILGVRLVESALWAIVLLIVWFIIGCSPPTDPSPVRNWVTIPYVVWADTLEFEYVGVDDSVIQRIVRAMDLPEESRDTFPDGLVYKKRGIPVDPRDRLPVEAVQ